MIKVCVLASGSEGNVTYVETKHQKILFDLGTNVKYITEKLAQLNVSPKEIDYIFISHVHNDHISAIQNFVKKYHPAICLSLNMFQEMPQIKDYDHIIIYEDEVVLENARIKVFKTSHDSDDSRSFILESEGKKVTYLTDTGYLNQKYFRMLENSDLYLFESNHDVEMLLNGPYPKWLKARVVGPSGHLSNIDSSIYLAKLIGPNTKKIILTHLSQKNNTEEKALETIRHTFEEYNIIFTDISCARQKEASELITL